MKKVYLKPNVVFEPLFDKWYVWSHLISPATAALNILGRHLEIMDSYIQAPKVHELAAKNPKMRGGPFMDLEGNQSDRIVALKQATLDEHHDLLAFAKALKELSIFLLEKADGCSLEPLYKDIPEILKGYVELVYDLNNQPSYRIFEHLLYRSPFYKTDAQSLVLWLTNNDERPFVLSTPRLESADTIHLDVPFSYEGIDQLSAMKRTPKAYEDIRPYFDIPSEKEALFQSLFTEEAPPQYNTYQGDQVRMRYFGHACILIETKDVSILLDPLISYYGYQNGIDRFSDMDLPDTIDYVLITHNHQDHILFETLLPLRKRIKNIVVPRTTGGTLQDPNLKLMFNNVGFDNIIEIDNMESIQFADCTITGLPFIGEHGGLNVQAKICHHVQVGDFSMLFAADACNVEDRLYQLIQKEVGNVDVIFLGMECEGAPLSWVYGPLLTKPLQRNQDQNRRLAGSNFERARGIVEAFNPLEVYVYAMGQEPWLEFISSIKYTAESKPIVQSDLLLEWCAENNIIAERLYGEKEILYQKYKSTEALAGVS